MEKSQKKVKKPLPFVILLVMTLLFVPGCGKREMDELIFVMGIGLDLGKEEGTYLVTLQMALPKASGGSTAELGNLTLSVETPSLALVEEKVNESLNKQLFTGATRVIILGEDLARSGIHEVLDTFQRYYQYRRTAYLLVAKGQAKDLLETEIRNQELPAISILTTIEGQNVLSAFPVTRLGHYLTILSREGQVPLIPTVEIVEPGQHGFYYKDKEGKDLVIHQAGVFEKGKMMEVLNDEESKGYLWLDNEVKSRFITAQGENGMELSAWVLGSKTKYKVEEMDGQVGIKFMIDTRLALREVVGENQEMQINEWRNYIKSIEPIFEQAIQKECERAIEKSKETQLDFIGIGRKIEIKEPKYWRQIKEKWEEEIVNFPVAVEVKAQVEHSGLVRHPASAIERK